MGWTALGLGDNEFALGLDYLKELEKSAAFPFLSANVLYSKDDSYVFEPYVIKNVSGFRVGITAVIGGDTGLRKNEKEVDIYVEDEISSLNRILSELEGKSDFIIVLSHTGFKGAEKLARKYGGVDLFVVGHLADSAHTQPSTVGSSLLVQGPPIGQYMLRLDIAIRNPQRPYNIETVTGKTPGNTIRSSLVVLDKRFAEDPDIQKIENEYKKKLAEYVNTAKMKKLNEGKRDPRALSAKLHYTGAESCRSCHTTQYDFWENTKHAIAFETLEKQDRQFETDCIKCHTTGFRKTGGFEDILTAKDLLGVQCESCLGPGSLHISKGVTPQNFFGEKTCLSCHDPENDDDFQYERDLKIIRCPADN